MTDAATTPAQTAPQQLQSAPDSPQPTTVDDLTRLLSEFDAETKPKEQSKPQAEPPKSEPGQAAEKKPPSSDFIAEVDRALGGMSMTSELRNHLQNYATTVHALHAQHVQQRDMADFEKIVSHFDREARERGYHLGEDYARRWIMAESMLNPQIEAVFNHRYDSADNARRADRMVKKAQERFLAAAKREPDQEATANRAAVAAAVRGAVTHMPEPPPVRYGDLNDAEFKAVLKKHGL